MIAMDKVHSIRQLFYEQGKSVSDIAAETGHDRKTISKYLDMTDFNTPEPKKEDPENMCLILSRLVDTFFSRISLTMQPPPKPHNTACVLPWEEGLHWQSRSSDCSSS